MLYFENGEWKPSPFIVRYKQYGEELEQYTHDKQWWIDFAEKWEHTEILGFVDVVLTHEQKGRLKDVQDSEEGFEYYASRYVLDGLFPDELEDEERLTNHPFKTLQLRKENEKQGQRITDANIKEMLQGQKQTDINLRLMKLEVMQNV